MKEYLHPVYIFLSTYLLCAILTYGYAYNNSKESQPFGKALVSSLSAMVFPLYWSVVLFKPEEVK